MIAIARKAFHTSRTLTRLNRRWREQNAAQSNNMKRRKLGGSSHARKAAKLDMRPHNASIDARRAASRPAQAGGMAARPSVIPEIHRECRRQLGFQP
jgi:hypothetical protein